MSREFEKKNVSRKLNRGDPSLICCQGDVWSIDAPHCTQDRSQPSQVAMLFSPFGWTPPPHLTLSAHAKPSPKDIKLKVLWHIGHCFNYQLKVVTRFHPSGQFLSCACWIQKYWCMHITCSTFSRVSLGIIVSISSEVRWNHLKLKFLQLSCMQSRICSQKYSRLQVSVSVPGRMSHLILIIAHNSTITKSLHAKDIVTRPLINNS